MGRPPSLNLTGSHTNIGRSRYKPSYTRRELARLPTNIQIQNMLVEVLSDGYASEDEETRPIVLGTPRSMFSPLGAHGNAGDGYRPQSRQKRRRSTPKPTSSLPSKVRTRVFLRFLPFLS
jgi:hypothetical protein